MVRFSFCGHELMALPQGALFWPARRALLVADLHLEKASWFAGSGRCCRPTIRSRPWPISTALAAATGAEEIWCLGDSFHDRHGCDRLPAAGARAADRADRARRAGPGSPAITIPASPTIAAARSSRRRRWTGCCSATRPIPAETRPELSGHFHPKLRISHRGRLVSRRCFVATERKLILPAFGALTGGLDARHPEIVRAVGEGAEALVPVQDRLLRFPIAA